MDYISTKELSNLWNVSTTRIVVMAKKGQIQGAKLIGKSWMFPKDAIKPVDGRLKKENATIVNKFKYPIYLLKKQDESDLTPLEGKLYKAEKLLNKMNYLEAYQELVNLVSTTSDSTLLIGCYYQLCSVCGMLDKYDEIIKYYNKIFEILSFDIPNKNELSILYYELTTYVKDNSVLNINYNEEMLYNLDSECSSEVTLIMLYKDILYYFNNGGTIDLNKYKIYSLIFDDVNYPLTSIYVNIFIALLAGMNNDIDNKVFYINKAIKSAMKNEIYHPLVIYYYYIFNSDTINRLTIPQDLLKTIEPNAIIYNRSLNDLKALTTTNNHIPNLTLEDYEYLNYLVKGLKSVDVAKLKNLTVKTICFKYKDIKEKLGCETKKEILEKYREYTLYREIK